MRMITASSAERGQGLGVRPGRAGQPIEVKRRIGYLPEAAPSYTEMS